MCTVVYMCPVLSLGYRGTVYQTTDLKRSTGLTYLSKLYLTSLVSCTTQFAFKLIKCFFTSRYIFVVKCFALSLFPCFYLWIVWSSSIAGGGHSGRTAAGMRVAVSSVRLCKCPLSIHHQTIKIALHPSITTLCSLSQPLFSKTQQKPPKGSC